MEIKKNVLGNKCKQILWKTWRQKNKCFLLSTMPGGKWSFLVGAGGEKVWIIFIGISEGKTKSIYCKAQHCVLLQFCCEDQNCVLNTIRSVFFKKWWMSPGESEGKSGWEVRWTCCWWPKMVAQWGKKQQHFIIIMSGRNAYVWSDTCNLDIGFPPPFYPVDTASVLT